MGQAKQRGTFEQRKASAKPKVKSTQLKTSRKPSGIIEYLMAAILGNHHV